MKMIAIKKHNRKLKVWSVELPNAPYSKRCGAFEKRNRLTTKQLTLLLTLTVLIGCSDKTTYKSAKAVVIDTKHRHWGEKDTMNWKYTINILMGATL